MSLAQAPHGSEDAGMPVVCLGEALVDLFCEEPVSSLGDARSFVPRAAGSLVNIAIAATRFGASVEMLGGAGDDEWGRWLREQVGREGVGTSHFTLMPGAATSHAFVIVSVEGEPRFLFYGDDERPAANAWPGARAALTGDRGILVVGSDTLVGAAEREVTMRVTGLARERGWLVLCDPNLRPNRWDDHALMLGSVRALVAASDVVKCNAYEAVELTGAGDEESAAAMLAQEAETAVVTRGARGALLATRGGTTDIPAPEVAVVDATGAGDCVAGVLAAALALGAGPGDLRAATSVAMAAAAAIVTSWGATDALPAAEDARAALGRALEAGGRG